MALTLSSFSFAAPIPGSMADPNNPHNMSNDPLNPGPKAAPTLSGGTDQICVFCHTPHSAAPQTPLWNRPDPTTATFPVYAQFLEINRDAAARAVSEYNNGNYPNGTSRMCLSCHDGATSIGVVLNGAPITMESGSETITSLSAIIDLASSHPISFKYDNTVLTTLLDSAAYQLPLVLVDTPLDAAERMQCTTCHDPHEDTSGDASYDNLPFWRHQGIADSTASYSEVCDNCHKTSPTSGSLPHTLP